MALKSFRMVALIACLFVAACAEEDVPYQCAAWCAADVSDVVHMSYLATDASDAQSQCFDQYNCSDMPGQLLRCMCEVE